MTALMLGLIVVFFAAAIVFWALQVGPQIQRVIPWVDEQGWPRRWLLRAAVPIWGRRCLNEALRAVKTPPALALAQPGEHYRQAEPIILDNCEWLLVAVQRRNDIGEPYGDLLLPLNPQVVYQFTPINPNELAIHRRRPDEIPLVQPRPVADKTDIPAILRYQSGVWMLVNKSPGSAPITVFQPQDGDNYKDATLYLVETRQPRYLKPGDRWVISFSEFQIERLPRRFELFAYPLSDGQKGEFIHAWEVPETGGISVPPAVVDEMVMPERPPMRLIGQALVFAPPGDVCHGPLNDNPECIDLSGWPKSRPPYLALQPGTVLRPGKTPQVEYHFDYARRQD